MHGRPSNTTHKKDHRPLAQVQTVGYEGGGARASAYDYNDVADSTDALPSAHKLRSRRDIDKLDDSKEDPIPKSKKKGANNAKAVAISGESFGANPMVHSSGGMEAIKNAKNRIPEDFLEHDDD